MKALHILHWLNPGGTENWVMSILRELHNRPSGQELLQIDILCKGVTTGEMSEEAASLGVKILHLPQGGLGYFSPGYKKKIEELIVRGNYSVVHSHLGDLSGPYLEAALAAGVSMRIANYHSIYNKLDRTSMPFLSKVPGLAGIFEFFLSNERKRVLASANCILGCSRSVLDERFQSWTNNSKFKIVHPIVDVARFLEALPVSLPSPQSNSGKSDEFRIINVGNVDCSKNQMIIPEVAAQMTALGINVVFYIAGYGYLLNALREKISRLGVGNQVVLLGKRSDIPGLLRNADLAFHPSIVEGFPVSVIEYQAAGLAVSGSDIGPMREACAPDNLSLLNAPDDIAGHVRVIQELARDKKKLAIASQTAELWAQTNFKPAPHVNELVKIYLGVKEPAVRTDL